jgi:hypothetical protein
MSETIICAVCGMGRIAFAHACKGDADYHEFSPVSTIRAAAERWVKADEAVRQWFHNDASSADPLALSVELEAARLALRAAVSPPRDQ